MSIPLKVFLVLGGNGSLFPQTKRKFKKALRDTLMRAAWYELLSTMANCG